MDKLEYKRHLIEACIKNRQAIAIHAKSAMDEAQQAANEYGQPKDRYDSFRMQQIRKTGMFAKQCEEALKEIDALRKINLKKPLDKVEFGALVNNGSQKILIAVGIGKLEFNKETIFVISPNVPVFKAMEDKKKGEKYSMNGKTFVIKDIV